MEAIILQDPLILKLSKILKYMMFKKLTAYNLKIYH